jgi:5'-3' exonuclease
MGVSGFFRDLVKRYPDTHFWDPNMSVDYLFFDFNGTIYTSLEKIKSDRWSFPRDTQQFETALINQVLRDTKDIVEMLDPKKSVYIAVDGPPPFAKMKQQRDRRNFGVWMRNFMKKEYNINSFGWDKSNISPGTIFMAKLDKEFKIRLRQKTWLGNYNVIYDGPRRPMEAEHKFLPMMDIISPEENIVIVSKDADQIILSMKYLKNSIYILRGLEGEIIQNKYPEGQQWVYLNVSKFTDLITKEYVWKPEQSKPTANQQEQFIVDLTFMSFIEGNDFVPALANLHFKTDKLKTPLKVYIQQELNGLVQKTDHYTLDAVRLCKLFEGIAGQEWLLTNRKRNEVHRVIEQYESGNSKCSDRPEEVEHLLIYCPNHPLFNQFYQEWSHLYDNMNMFQWKKAYYRHFLGSRYNINNVCRDYSKALLFNLRYYFADVIYWRYQYPHSIAPMPSDYAKYLKANPNVFNELEYDMEGPVNPFVQLAYVLPRATMYLLPKVYTQTFLNKKEYPVQSKLDLLTGDKLIYIDMDLPQIYLNNLVADYDRVKDNFTEKEKDRDGMETKPLIFWCDE